ncbi:hypothetical protein AAMO2058_001449800 [Amorphochlora amoebiformis]
MSNSNPHPSPVPHTDRSKQDRKGKNELEDVKGVPSEKIAGNLKYSPTNAKNSGTAPEYVSVTVLKLAHFPSKYGPFFDLKASELEKRAMTHFGQETYARIQAELNPPIQIRTLILDSEEEQNDRRRRDDDSSPRRRHRDNRRRDRHESRRRRYKDRSPDTYKRRRRSPDTYKRGRRPSDRYKRRRRESRSMSRDKGDEKRLPARTVKVFSDDLLPGGTKQRGLGVILMASLGKCHLYAGPENGFAQVALAVASKACGKKAISVVSAPRKGKRHSSVQEAEKYGAEIVEVNSKKILTVAGSAVLLATFHRLWPKTHFLVVQVGKKIWTDQLEGKISTKFVAKEKFYEPARISTPYPSVDTYDAKVWQFVLKHAVDGDYVWNVARDPPPML